MKHRLLNFTLKKLKLLLVVLGIVLISNTIEAQDPVVVAGGVTQPTGLPQDGADAWNIGRAAMLRVDSQGNMFYSDYYQGLGLMKRDVDGVISVFVKDDGADYGFGGPRELASVNNRITGVVIDCDDNVYFSNADGVWMVDVETDYIYRVLENDDPILSPAGMAFNDDCSVLYINDLSNSAPKGNGIWGMEVATGTLTRVAGNGVRNDDGFGTLALNSAMREPFGLDYIKIGGTEYLYVAGQQKRISRVNLNTGVKDLIAGSGSWSYGGDGGLAVDAALKQPHDILISPDNKMVYFGDHQANTLRYVDLNTGIIDVLVGDAATRGRYEDILPDGHRTDDVLVNRAIGVDWDLDGKLIYTDRGDPLYSLIRKVDGDTVTTLAGNGDIPMQPEEGILATDLWTSSFAARGVAEDSEGNVYVSDNIAKVIRKIGADGTVSTVCGVYMKTDYTGGGAFDTATISSPQQMLLANDTLLYMADDGHDVIYQIDLKNEMISVVVGTGAGGYTESGSAGNVTQIADPRAIALWGDTLYFNERGNKIIRKVKTDGTMVMDVAGVKGVNAANADEELGKASEAKFRDPTALAVDNAGNVYIATDRNDLIRKLDALKDTVVAWCTTKFNNPYGMFFDGTRILMAEGGGGKTWSIALDGKATEISAKTPGATNVAPGPSGIWVTGYTSGLFLLADAADALTKIDAMAKADDASGLSPALLDVAGATGVMGGWLGVYRDTVAGAPSVPRLDTLQFMVDTVNAIEAMIALNTYGADTMGMVDVHIWVLTQTEDLVVENAAEYMDSLLAKSDDGANILDYAAVQALVDEVNANSATAALDTIDGMAAADDAATLTIALLVQAGVESAKVGDMVYMKAYKDSVAAQDGFANLGELQDVIDDANMGEALKHIKWMADNDVSILTIADLENASDESAEKDNLMAYKYALADTGGAAIMDAGDVEGLIDAVDDEIGQLVTINAMVKADTSTLDSTLLADAGIVFITANMATYKAFIHDDTTAAGVPNEYDYKTDLQARIDVAEAKIAADVAAAAVDAAIVVIQGYADGDDATAMTVVEIEAAGGDVACDDANLALYKTWVADTSGTFIANTDSLQWLIDAADLVALDAKGGAFDTMARKDNASGLVMSDFCIVEIAVAIDTLLAEYKDSIAAADSIDSKAALQAIVDGVNARNQVIADAIAAAEKVIADSLALEAKLDIIQGYADADDADDLTLYYLVDIGVTVMYADEYLPAYRGAVEDSAGTAFATVAGVQAMVDAVNAKVGATVVADALAAIDAMAVASDASDLTRDLLADALGSEALLKGTLRHFVLYQDSVAGADSVKTVAALEAIIASANTQKAIEVVQAYADASNAASMTTGELVDAGVDQAAIMTYNLEAYQGAVADSTGAALSTSAKIEALVVAVNVQETANALDTILAMTVAGDASTLTTTMLKKAGFEYESDYLEAYQAALGTVGALTTFEEVQAVIDEVDALEMIKGMPGDNSADDLTIEMAELAGGTDLFEAFLDNYKNAVFDADTIADLAGFQAIIDATNLASVLEMAELSDASALTEDLLVLVGATDVRTANMEAYQTAIEAEASLADLAALQAVIDAVNIVNVEDFFSNNNLSIYPNPTNGRLYVDLKQVPAEGIDVEVSDITGRIILRTHLDDARSVIDITGESSGVYFLQLTVEDNVVTKRIMLQ